MATSGSSVTTGRDWPARMAATAGLYAAAAGLAALAGWAAEIPRLTDWKGDGIAMFPNTAACAVLSGLALVLLAVRPARSRAVVRLFAGVVMLIAGLTLAEHVGGVDLGIDRLVFDRPWGQAAAAAPMRMGPPASVAFLVTGLALFLVTAGEDRRRAGIGLACVIMTIGTLSLTGHLYGASPMYMVPRLTGIAMQTASVVLAVGIGVVATVPEREPVRTLREATAAGVLVRRAVPVIVVIAIGLGGLRVYLEARGLLDSPFGSASRTVAELVLLTASLWWVAARVRSYEEALHASQADVRRHAAQLTAFVDTAAIALHRVGPDGIILWANDAELKAFGYRRDEYIGHHIAEFHVDQDVIADILARLHRGEKLYEYPARIRCRDGSVRDVLIDANVLWDDEGRFVHTQGFTRDVTERKQAAARAARDHEATSRFYEIGKRCTRPGDHLIENLSEILDAAIWITGADRGNIQLYDPACDALKLVVHRGFEARFAEVFASIQRDAASACRAALASRQRVVVEDVTTSAVFAGQPSLKLLLDAGVRAVQATPLVSSTGAILGMISTHFARPHRPDDRDSRLLDVLARQAADYVERKRSEEQREELLRVAESARADAEAANAAKDEFLAMLAHELRNPLAAVRNALAAATLHERMRPRALEIARRQSELLGRIVDDLLDVARITRGRVRLRKERVSLVDVVQRTVEGAHGIMEERGHTLTFSAPPERIDVEADATRIEQAVANVLANAAKYTDPGGTITVTVEREGADAVVRVRDNGIGIAPDVLPHVFDLFMQGGRALDRAQGGLGIGLTLVRRIVELHGGSVEAKSPGTGGGSEFVLRLRALAPVADELPPQPSDSHRRSPDHHTARVLMVEDNPDAAESLVMILELLGHHVRVVHDGVAALEAARANAPDVMLVDIGLPGMDGYEVAQAIRRDPTLHHLVLVALTGYGRPEDKARAIAAGFDYHLVKPVDLQALGDVVARLGSRGAGSRSETVH